MKNNIITFYVLLLILHLAHIIEEVIGNAPFIASLYGGVTNFLLINIGLLILPLIILYLLYSQKRYALYFALIYGVIMFLDGLDHLWEGTAGIYSGSVMIIVATFVIVASWKEIRSKAAILSNKQTSSHKP